MKLNTFIQAIAHPIRRDILKQLRVGPLTAGDLAAFHNVAKPTMSEHFKTLKEVGLIRGVRNGNHIIYHLNLTVAEEAIALVVNMLGTNKMEEKSEQTDIVLDRNTYGN